MEEDKDELAKSEVLTLAEIAGYLKISEKTILRMARNGEIPSTKIASQWRFFRPMVDDWLTSKMQLASRQDLVRVIRTADRVVPIARLITPERILLDLTPGSKESILTQLIKPLVADRIVMDAMAFLEKLIEREQMISTGIGKGIALPHVRAPEEIQVGEPCIVLGVCKEGADFKSLDGEKTYLFALLCSNSDLVHLRLMAKMTLLLRNPETVNKIRDARNVGEVASLLIDADTELRSFF